MKKEEAEKKWCPFARVTSEGYGSFNRHTGTVPVEDCFCITDRCMAWECEYQQVQTPKGFRLKKVESEGYCNLMKI